MPRAMQDGGNSGDVFCTFCDDKIESKFEIKS